MEGIDLGIYCGPGTIYRQRWNGTMHLQSVLAFFENDPSYPLPSIGDRSVIRAATERYR
jgi:hypothetical protein